MGSAQTWHASSLLQHGSIVVRPQVETWLRLVRPEGESPAALRARLADRLTSVEEILGWTLKLAEIKEAVRLGMAQALKVELQPGELSAEEWTLARDLAHQEEEKPNVPTGHHPDFSGKVHGGHHRPERRG